MNCHVCGAPIENGATFCPNCGAAVSANNTQQPFQQPFQQPYQQPQVSNPGKGLGITSMVLGIVSLALFCVPYVPIICAILGIALGGVGIHKSKSVNLKNGFAVAGLVCSIVSLAFYATILITGAAILDSLSLL